MEEKIKKFYADTLVGNFPVGLLRQADKKGN
jgi:hypothetical protein